MGKVGGNRNFGYGKQLAWAGKNALEDRYGKGHFSTQATHADRWNQFAEYLKETEIKDARQINEEILSDYGEFLKEQVAQDQISVTYAQNLLSTVNVVLETMRKDSTLSLSFIVLFILLQPAI